MCWVCQWGNTVLNLQQLNSAEFDENNYYFIWSENLGHTAANLLVYRVNSVIIYLFGLQEFIESK